MPRDGQGNMTVPNPDFVSGEVISSDQVDANFQDIASELGNSLPRDGQAAPTANLPMGGYRLTGVGDGVGATDTVTVRQAQAQALIWAGNATGTANALIVTPNPEITALTTGTALRFRAAANNTGPVTLAVSALQPVSVLNAGAFLVADDFEAGKIYEILFDGTAFQVRNWAIGGGSGSGGGISAQTQNAAGGPFYIRNFDWWGPGSRGTPPNVFGGVPANNSSWDGPSGSYVGDGLGGLIDQQTVDVTATTGSTTLVTDNALIGTTGGGVGADTWAAVIRWSDNTFSNVIIDGHLGNNLVLRDPAPRSGAGVLAPMWSAAQAQHVTRLGTEYLAWRLANERLIDCVTGELVKWVDSNRNANAQDMFALTATSVANGSENLDGIQINVLGSPSGNVQAVSGAQHFVVRRNNLDSMLRVGGNAAGEGIEYAFNDLGRQRVIDAWAVVDDRATASPSGDPRAELVLLSTDGTAVIDRRTVTQTLQHFVFVVPAGLSGKLALRHIGTGSDGGSGNQRMYMFLGPVFDRLVDVDPAVPLIGAGENWVVVFDSWGGWYRPTATVTEDSQLTTSLRQYAQAGTIRNYSKGGETMAWVIQEWANIAALEPDGIILNFAINDQGAGVSIANWLEDFFTVVALAGAAGIKVALLEPLPTASPAQTQNLTAYAASLPIGTDTLEPRTIGTLDLDSADSWWTNTANVRRGRIAQTPDGVRYLFNPSRTPPWAAVERNVAFALANLSTAVDVAPYSVSGVDWETLDSGGAHTGTRFQGFSAQSYGGATDITVAWTADETEDTQAFAITYGAGSSGSANTRMVHAISTDDLTSGNDVALVIDFEGSSPNLPVSVQHNLTGSFLSETVTTDGNGAAQLETRVTVTNTTDPVLRFEALPDRGALPAGPFTIKINETILFDVTDADLNAGLNFLTMTATEIGGIVRPKEEVQSGGGDGGTGGPGFVAQQTITVSSGQTHVDISFPASRTIVEIIATGFLPETDSANLRGRFITGGAPVSTASSHDSALQGTQSAGGIQDARVDDEIVFNLASGTSEVSNSAESAGVDMSLRVLDPRDSGKRTRILGELTTAQTSPDRRRTVIHVAAGSQAAADHTGLRLYWVSTPGDAINMGGGQIIVRYWDPVSGGQGGTSSLVQAGAMVSSDANNAATHGADDLIYVDQTAFATAAQGALAATALQTADVGAAALDNAYTSLDGRPTFAAVATEGTYASLLSKPDFVENGIASENADGTTDDAANLTAALSAGGVIRLTPGATYALASKSNMGSNTADIIIEGNGATIRAQEAMDLRLTRGTHTAGAYFTTVAGSMTFTIPGGVTIVAGDVVELLSDDVYIDTTDADYTHGQICKIVDVTGSTATMSVPFYAAFEVDTINVYHGVSYHFRDITFDARGNDGTGTAPRALVLTGANITLENCHFIGDDNAGIGAELIGDFVRVTRCTAAGFTNVQGIDGASGGRWGYGFSINGNDVAATSCATRNCKHGFFSGLRNSTTRRYTLMNNVFVSDPALRTINTTPGGGSAQPVKQADADAHASVLNFICIGNYFEGPNMFVAARGVRSHIAHNVMRSHGGNDGFTNYHVCSQYEAPAEFFCVENNFVSMVGAATPTGMVLAGVQALRRGDYGTIKIAGNHCDTGDVQLMRWAFGGSFDATEATNTTGDKIIITGNTGTWSQGGEFVSSNVTGLWNQIVWDNVIDLAPDSVASGSAPNGGAFDLRGVPFDRFDARGFANAPTCTPLFCFTLGAAGTALTKFTEIDIRGLKIVSGNGGFGVLNDGTTAGGRILADNVDIDYGDLGNGSHGGLYTRLFDGSTAYQPDVVSVRNAQLNLAASQISSPPANTQGLRIIGTAGTVRAEGLQANNGTSPALDYVGQIAIIESGGSAPTGPVLTIEKAAP